LSRELSIGAEVLPRGSVGALCYANTDSSGLQVSGRLAADRRDEGVEKAKSRI
jgi:hypothetical protein